MALRSYNEQIRLHLFHHFVNRLFDTSRNNLGLRRNPLVAQPLGGGLTLFFKASVGIFKGRFCIHAMKPR